MNYEINSRNKVLRAKERGVYDKESVYKILDAGKICHVGITMEGQPFVIPMSYARIDNSIILHGALNSRLCSSLREGIPACVTVTHLDGLVLARSTFHHSMNYRSVVAFGTAREIDDKQKKLEAAEALVEFLTPGRTTDCRAPNKKELNATSMIEFTIEQASAKVRTGGPIDLEKDLDLDVWAGVVPIKEQFGEWIAADDLKSEIDYPDYKNLY
ncbi:MAG: pyridoxamine 5'-phosphate oxidase family protein [Cocleimonas sp.]|nr:pyridoxamine 5'-phosphate oxidase family protein [Cocleimonas sp.]